MQINDVKYDDYIFCLACSDAIDYVYKFNKKCLRNLRTFLDYKTQLGGFHKKQCGLIVRLSDKEIALTKNKNRIKLEDANTDTSSILSNAFQPEENLEQLENSPQLVDDEKTFKNTGSEQFQNNTNIGRDEKYEIKKEIILKDGILNYDAIEIDTIIIPKEESDTETDDSDSDYVDDNALGEDITQDEEG